MIEIQNLKKSYRKGKDIIPNLNLTFGETGLTIIAGKSGCGKTTLLNILGSMDMDFKGKVLIDGADLKKKSYKEIVDYRNFTSAFVFQKNSLFEFLTVEENLKLCMNIQNNKASISEALEQVGLKGFEHKKVKSLSGGEKQRVAIARALIKNCKIIFADEPTSALDTKNAHKIFQLFKDISKDKLVILVTHDIKKATQYADRMVRFVDGEVVEDITYHETNNKARELPERKTKKFALMPILFNHLKKGLAINLFVMLLFMAAITVTNLAVAGIKVKNEYDNFGTPNFNFNVDRSIATSIKNNVTKYNVIKRGNITDPYFTIKNVYTGDMKLNDVDAKIIENTLSDFNIQYGTNDSLNNKLLIDGVSNQKTMSYSRGGRYFYWEQLSTTDYIYYLYNKNINYELYSHSKLPNPNNKEEILIADVVAWQYLCNNYQEFGYTSIDQVKMEDIYDVDFVIFDNYGVYTNGTTDYYIGDPVHYKVVGVINTHQLDYYDYSYDQMKYKYKSYFKNQDNDKYAIFMNSIKSQPFGYVVLQEPLQSSVGHAFYYNIFQTGTMNVILNDETFKLSNSNVQAFLGEYDYSTNAIEMYDREKSGSNGTHQQYELFGHEDNLTIDYENRIIALSTDEDELKDNEIILTLQLARQLFPTLSFDNLLNQRNSFAQIANQEITLEYNNGFGNIYTKAKIVGLAKNTSNGLFYASNNLYQTIYSNIYSQARTMTIDVKGMTVSEIKALFVKLYNLGYSLSPIDNMPSAYLEFVEGKGETYAEVDGDGLASLYPNYELQEIGGTYYFVNEGVTFGFAEPTFDSLGNVKEVGTVYMTSTVIRKIVLDESYIEKNLGNLSLYYLFSDYYTFDNTNSGNYILEIISSMYLFLLGMASLIALGFIYLKENKEKGTMTRLSMLGVRPMHIYLLHFVTYLGMALIICFSAIGLSRLFTNVINGLFAYTFDNGLTIYRYRLMFTNEAIIYAIVLSSVMFICSMLLSIFVTFKNRK